MDANAATQATAKLLKVDEVAARWGLNRATVYRLVQRGGAAGVADRWFDPDRPRRGRAVALRRLEICRGAVAVNRSLQRRIKQIELRAELQKRVAAALAKPAQPTIAAVHEAAHELLARRYGCEVLACFVYPDGVRGATFFEAPLWRVDRDRPILDPLGQIRARAATAMAGPAAEALWKQRPVPDAETLLLSELTNSREVPNELERLFRMTFVAFKPPGRLNVEAARRALNHGTTWLSAMLTGTRLQTLDVLINEWPDVLARARELDHSAQQRAA